MKSAKSARKDGESKSRTSWSAVGVSGQKPTGGASVAREGTEMRESQIDHDAAWQILVERKAERKESRTAFIAALLMARSRIPGGAPGGELMPPHMGEAFAVELVRLATAIHALCEADCNTGLTERQESRQKHLERRFGAIANALGFEARTGGDPRGACAYLIDPDDRSGDGWGEGWAVYR
jgi:hypothetical protein